MPFPPKAAGLITRLVAADKLEAEALNLAAAIATQSLPIVRAAKKPSTPLLTQRWKADYKWSGVFFMLPPIMPTAMKGYRLF